ncbi:ABC transporter ATP-binding protein [Bauldia sp.]|uniref:ABC transporter ATP-binding protein n=1 Tax=Bauldia sp. TaxID=2575872 RepID=UPI003BACB4BE
MSPLLSVEGLRVGFGADPNPVIAVQDMSFAIDPGEVVALVGESGSGKSVTALSIMRLVEYGGGRILAGQLMFDTGAGPVDLTTHNATEIAALRGNAMAMIFQEPMTSLNPIYTIGEQIMEPLRLHRGTSGRDARTRATELLDRVRLADPERQMGRYPHELSGGQRQRVMLAIALACAPKLLIADEPTTALDVTIQAQILDLMRELQAETGAALLFITHDMAVVAEIADRVVVMRAGEKVEEAPVADLFAAPRQPYTQALLAAAPRLGALAGTDSPRYFATPTDAPSRPVNGNPAPLVEVRDLVTRFPVRTGLLRRKTAEIHAVEMASFDIATGQTLALVGESGSGKSTLARSILRLVEPTSGSVRLDGQDLTRLEPEPMRKVRARMQIVFQDPYASMNPRRQVYDQIADPVRIHGHADEAELRASVEDLIAHVGLSPDCLEQFPHEFSGGQRQRLCIARALSLSPDLIVADEPVSALDVSIQAQVLDLLIALQERLGISYLFISHDMAVVERIAHRVAVMRQGRIVELGPRRAVFEAPQHPYTRQLLDAVPIADPAQRRNRRRVLPSAPSKSPIHPFGQQPRPIAYAEVGPGHIVERFDS